MLSPKKVKWRKQQKGRMKGRANRGNTITYGDYGLVAETCGYITNRQLEAARIAISRHTKRGGSMWIKIFPDKSLTKKPAEVRMGKGKGNPEQWVAVVKPGRILFEVGGLGDQVSKEALNLARYKLPIKTKVVKKSAATTKAGHVAHTLAQKVKEEVKPVAAAAPAAAPAGKAAPAAKAAPAKAPAKK